jgi:S-DNA-T family DNA segregation ATPase FtsK/SpoIIIE
MLFEDGGMLGVFLTDLLTPAIGIAGTYVVLVICMIICLVLITEKSLLKPMRRGSEKAYDRAKQDVVRRKEQRAVKREETRVIRQEEQKTKAEQKRVEKLVSGVSFNTTLEEKKPEKEAVLQEVKTEEPKKVKKSKNIEPAEEQQNSKLMKS